MSAVLKLCAFVCFAFLISSPFASAQNSLACYTTQNGMFYNLTGLMGMNIVGYNPAGDTAFYLNMCTVADFCNVYGAMICQAGTDQTPTGTVYDVAFPNDDIAPHYWQAINGGIELVAFGSRIYCQSFGNERTGVVRVLCDPRVTGPITLMSAAVVESPPCTYTMTINHTLGCPIALPPPTTPAPVPNTTTTAPFSCAPCVSNIGGSSTDQSTVTGAGFGVGIAVGIVLCAVTTLVYVYVSSHRGKKWKEVDEDKGLKMGNLGSAGSDAHEEATA